MGQEFVPLVPPDRPVRSVPNRPRLSLVTAQDLGRVEFPDIAYVVPGLVAEGLTILAGKPKGGKSWWCLDIAVAVATGGVALGSIPTDPGDALYLALEDNPRRLQRRLRQLLGTGDLPARLSFATDCPPLDRGGLAAIEGWAQEAVKPRLIIVDVFAKVRPDRRKDDGLYEADYRAVAPLKELADRLGLAVIIVHHTSKRTEAADPFDTISGTTGLTGAADTVLILSATPDGPKVYGRGRDIEELEKAMRFDRTSGRWLLLGDASEVVRSNEQKAVLDILDKATEPMSPAVVAEMLGKKVNTINVLLRRMAERGDVVKEARGRYRHRNRWENADPCQNGQNVRMRGDDYA
jgi:hypothetical protein